MLENEAYETLDRVARAVQAGLKKVASPDQKAAFIEMLKVAARMEGELRSKAKDKKHG